MDTVWISPWAITPRHEVRDRGKLASLAEAMAEDGWQGRPLLVIDDAVPFALTGSHRIAAAREAELQEVPVCSLPWDTWEQLVDGCGRPHDDDDIRSALAWGAAEGLEGCREALQLMKEEEDE